MSPASEGTSGKKAVGGGDSVDIYTALLGLAMLILAATVGLVCYLGQQRYESIFGVVKDIF